MRSAVPTKAVREALMSRNRRLKIEGGAFFYTLALADWPVSSFHRYVAQGTLQLMLPFSIRASRPQFFDKFWALSD